MTCMDDILNLFLPSWLLCQLAYRCCRSRGRGGTGRAACASVETAACTADQYAALWGNECEMCGKCENCGLGVRELRDGRKAGIGG